MDNKINDCVNCHKRVRQHERIIQCTTCKYPTHCNCLPTYSTADIEYARELSNDWSCINCLKTLFPFHSLENNEEILTPVTGCPHINIDDLENMLFDPFEPDDDDSNIFDDIDPDRNFYSVNTNNIFNRSKYYYPETLCNLVKDWTDQKNISLMHLNIRSIRKNHTNLDILLKTINHKFSIIGLTETWLKDYNTSLFDLDGYAHEYIYRPVKQGGGVSMFISNDLNYKVRPDLGFSNNNIEMLWVEVDKNCLNLEKNCIIGTVYRRPGSGIIDFNILLN